MVVTDKNSLRRRLAEGKERRAYERFSAALARAEVASTDDSMTDSLVAQAQDALTEWERCLWTLENMS